VRLHSSRSAYLIQLELTLLRAQGNDFFAAGEWEKAVVSFTTASIIHPSQPTFAANSAAARMKMNTPEQYAEAVSDCTIALYSDPSHIKALYRRGVCLAMLGHWKAAFAGALALSTQISDAAC
jgi:tetratricopeptide (TPR) repeat protein